MNRMLRKIIASLLFCLLVSLDDKALLSSEKEADVINLISDQLEEVGLPKGWKPLIFPKISNHTLYTLVHEEGRTEIKAESHQSASGLYVPIELNPKVYSVLSWCWKINRIIEKGEETRKEGDDYAARIYVTFKYDSENASLWERTKYGTIKLLYGKYPPKAAINYVWANHLQKGNVIPSPYTDRARMVAIESGAEWVGQRRCETRNIFEDYKRFFLKDPPSLSGIAVMTDTDNTLEEATAFYSDIVIRKPAEP